jgi:hypothetical protein
MKHKVFTKYLMAVGLASMILVPVTAAAQLNFGIPASTNMFSNIFGCGGAEGILCILRRVLNFILSIAFITAVIFLVVGGFRYITSQGNEDGIEKAKGTITNAIIGIVVIVLAWIILTLILNLVISGSAGGNLIP